MADLEKVRSQLAGKLQHRELQIQRSAVDEDERRAALSFASTAPYERWWGVEILDLKPGSVRLDRLRRGAQLLVNHDSNQVAGVIEEARIDADRKARATVRFGKSAFASEIFQDVVDGIRSSVSVGYAIHDLVLEKRGEAGQPDTYRVTDWEPYEVSIVSVPADAGVGVGRAAGPPLAAARDQGRMLERALVPECDRKGFSYHLAHRDDGEKVETDLAVRGEYERYRVASIRAIAKAWPRVVSEQDVDNAIAENVAVDEFRSRTFAAMDKAQLPPTETGHLEADRAPRIEIVERQTNNIRGPRANERAHACGMFFKSLTGDGAAQRWVREHGLYGERVMTEGVFSAGGATVPAQIAAEILSLVDSYGTFRANARIWPMDSASLGIPRSLEGLTVAGVGENTATPTSDLATGQIGLNAKEFSGACRVSRSLLMDNAVMLGDFIVNEFSRKLAEAEDAAGYVGDGTSTYGGISGIKTLLDTAAYSASKVAAATPHDTLAELDNADLTALMAKLPEYARRGAKFYCSGTVRDLVFSRLMAVAGGNSTQTLGGAAPSSYLGYEIVTSPKLPATTTAYTTVEIIFGNLQLGSAFGARAGLQVDVDLSRYVEYRQVLYQVSERFDIVNFGVNKSTTVPGCIVGLCGTT